MGSKRLVCVLLGITVFISAVLSQTTEGTVSGIVTDPTDAHVAGAAVTALNVGIGVGTATLTNSAGGYVFASLPPGRYRITAEHPGFRRTMSASRFRLAPRRKTSRIPRSSARRILRSAALTSAASPAPPVHIGFWCCKRA